MRGSEISSEYLRTGEIWTCALGWHEQGSQLGPKEHLLPLGLHSFGNLLLAPATVQQPPMVWVVCPRMRVFPRR